jgi:hypothetical protein
MSCIPSTARIAENRRQCLKTAKPLFLTSADFDALDAGLGICPAFKNRVSGQCYRSSIGDRVAKSRTI